MPVQVNLPNRVVVDGFHQLYYHDPATWPRNTFLGYPILQSPTDMYLYQEVLARIRPKFIVQTGVNEGGSILYLACLLDLIGAAQEAVVVGVDVRLTQTARTITHARVRLVEGDSTDPAITAKVRAAIPEGGGLVSLDSDHSQSHVEREMAAYGDFVAIGSYLVVEDTNINGHPVLSGFGPGPAEAVQRFLASDSRFVSDNELWKRQLFSFHQGGWLKRVR